MAFFIQKLSNYGTANPVVARLSVQSSELIRFSNLSKDEQENTLELYFHTLQPRLLKCHEAFARLIQAKEKTIAEIKPQSDKRIQNIPSVVGLQGEVETYLYEAKNYLRDMLAVIKIFFGDVFNEANAFYGAKAGQKSALVCWAEKKFGANDPFTEMLQTEQPWIEDIIRMRNAAEHPGGNSGTLFIRNFEVTSAGIAAPSWWRDERKRTDLFHDIEVGLDNMLTLAEDILVSCIHHRLAFPHIVFVQIPAAERLPDCPQRIRVQPSPELAAKFRGPGGIA
jgi:hypothetical protein